MKILQKGKLKRKMEQIFKLKNGTKTIILYHMEAL